MIPPDSSPIHPLFPALLGFPALVSDLFEYEGIFSTYSVRIHSLVRTATGFFTPIADFFVHADANYRSSDIKRVPPRIDFACRIILGFAGLKKERAMPIVDVIQFEGDPSVLVWKSPIEDFNNASQLIVDEAHEALVMIEGRVEVFGAGRHALDPQNYFGMNAIQRFATGGKTIFPCKVYFVNKVHSMDLLWGTAETLPVVDPVYDIPLHLQLHGNLTFVIDNSKKFAEKFTGFFDRFSNDQFSKHFRGIIATAVTSQVARVVNNAKIGYYELNSHLDEISSILFPVIGKQFDEYGVKLVKFNIETIKAGDSDLAVLEKAKNAALATRTEAEASAYATRTKAAAAAEARSVQGFTWSDEQKANILQSLASNDGNTGTFMGGMIGLNMAGGMGAPLSNVAGDFFGSQQPTSNSVFSNAAQGQEASTLAAAAAGSGLSAQGTQVPPMPQTATDQLPPQPSSVSQTPPPAAASRRLSMSRTPSPA